MAIELGQTRLGLVENIFLKRLEVLQYQIDLKIEHLNERERLSMEGAIPRQVQDE